MSAYIKPEHLTFLEECKMVFGTIDRRETHQNKDGTLIAFRYGEDRDCIKMFELGEEVAFFTQQIEPYPSFRNEVFYFAMDMEEQLKANDHKCGWGNTEAGYLVRAICMKLDSLSNALLKEDKDKCEITKRCADIANYAMMIADNEGEHL